MKPRILVVDDEEKMCQVLKMVFDRSGYETSIATRAKEALELFVKESYDLVITDLKMPDMDGISLIKELKRQNKDIPVILITAYGTIKTAISAMKEGAFDYIMKPLDNEELKKVASNALELSRLSRENKYLRNELKSKYGVDNIIGKNPKMMEILDLVMRIANTKSTVLIQGESGTGKELIARAIHFHSDRVGNPFIAINCRALSENLLESEIFGHEKGAFTGAGSAKPGRFELADKGTIFLDEIGDVSLSFQSKLLRVLQEEEFERVGGTKTIKVDVRVVTATNQDLKKRIADGQFREDLFFRLNVIPIYIPTLRDRRDDIMPFAYHFLQKYNDEMEKNIKDFSDEVKDFFHRYKWPGNVRELENSIERGVNLTRGEILMLDDLLMDKVPSEDLKIEGMMTLRRYLDHASKNYILEILEKQDWKKEKTADILGIDRATLYRLMKKFLIE